MTRWYWRGGLVVGYLTLICLSVLAGERRSTILTLTLLEPPLAAIPPAPTGLQLESIERTAGRVDFRWQPPMDAPDVVGYQLDLGVQSGHYTERRVAGIDPTVSLEGLVGNQRYYAVVRAVNAAGVWSPYSLELSFALMSSLDEVDTEPPQVAIISITDGNQSVSSGGTVRRNLPVVVTMDATDTHVVVAVELRVNDVSVCIEQHPPYACIWQVPPKAKVPYRLQAFATDGAGHRAPSAIWTVTSR